MNIVTILIFILFFSELFYEVKCIKDLIIPTKKRNIEIIFLIISIIVILGLTYIYASTWTHYMVGISASAIIGLNLYKTGITSKGFSYPVGYTGGLASHAPWDKIKRVQISQKEYVMVTFSGSSYQKLYFKKQDYEKVVNILKENLPLYVIHTD